MANWRMVLICSFIAASIGKGPDIASDVHFPLLAITSLGQHQLMSHLLSHAQTSSILWTWRLRRVFLCVAGGYDSRRSGDSRFSDGQQQSRKKKPISVDGRDDRSVPFKLMTGWS
ncbi:unnamed protein product [Victoria cruziana]